METKAKLTVKEVLEEVKCAMDDCFVARIKQEENRLEIRFLNGQIFYLHITEKE
jgi:hypothetical protein